MTNSLDEKYPFRAAAEQDPSIMNGKVYTAQQIANRLGCNTQTLYSWIRRGTFPNGISMSTHRRIWPESWIANWERQHAETRGINMEAAG